MTEDSSLIRQLYEAARAEERAKQEAKAVLSEINRSLSEMKDSLRHTRNMATAAYNNSVVAIELLSALWGGDREQLKKIKDRAMRTAFEKQETGIKIEAGGDVSVSADEVGGDKERT